jgi:hypothetical protein
MRTGALRRGSVFALAAIACAAWAPAAGADTDDIIAPSNPDEPKVDSGWQAGTCNFDTPECNVDSPDSQFFETAAGHPPVGFTQFIIKHEDAGVIGEIPVGNLKTVRVDLPAGLTVNPQATIDQCELEPEESPATCPPTSKVGISVVRATNPLTGFTQTLPAADVFNVEPVEGEPARFGFSVLGNDVFLEAGVAWESDYHEFFTIHAHKLELPGVPGLEVARVAENRLSFEGRAGDGTFITTPSTCFGEALPGPFQQIYSTYLRADSFEVEDPNFPNGSSFFESRIPPERSPKECEGIPFEPSIAMEPNTAQTDSPSGAAVTVDLPWIEGGEEQQSSPVRKAQVSLPLGMGLNPSAANNLKACTDAEFGKGTRNPVACPSASKIGTVSVDTPPLGLPVAGDVYVGQQLSSDPASGQLYRIFVDAESARYGISARLVGNVSANPLTGQLTTTFDEGPLGSVPLPGLPQVPFRSFELKFNEGARAPLTSPPTCGPNATATQMTPWSSAVGPVPPGGEEGPSTDPPATPSNEFSLTETPGLGACAKTLAERPFSPAFGARSEKPRGGAYSPFEVALTRSDGNQELKVVDVVLPPGHSAKLAGLRYCPEGAIAAATANSGASEATTPSCPDSSFIGTAIARAGTGSDPIQIDGKAFLAGPYKGAPLSLVFVTPATAGPFDLGSVVVRVALFVEPETAQIHAVSDPIPHVFGGALLDLRSVVVKTDRPNFSLNPTNCAPLTATGTLRGGGANPLDPAAFSAFPISALLQVNNCNRLGFKPKLRLRVFGGMRRAKNPKLRATLVARGGDANIGRAAVALPRPFFLDQASLAKVCTRVQFAANDCPKNSIYGHARAITPLLDGPLKGPVYLRSSDNPLPDLVARLRGQVEIVLVGRTDSVKGRIRNTFDRTPDVPVSKFMLTIRGGKKGLLVNSQNLCKLGPKRLRAIARFKAHNGKKANMRPRLRTACPK